RSNRVRRRHGGMGERRPDRARDPDRLRRAPGAGAMTRRLCAAFLAALLAGCARAPTPPEAVPARPAAFPEAYYRDAAARGDAVYRIDPTRSLATVREFRTGPLARFGHEPGIAARSVHRHVSLALEQHRGDLQPA